MYCFEFDEKKSISNLKKYGIDFVTAQEFWNDPDLIEIQAIYNTEPRFLLIGDLDLSTLRRPNQKQKRVNVDFPVWVIDSLDKEASRVGVTRQSIIKLWLVERLEELALTRQRHSDR